METKTLTVNGVVSFSGHRTNRIAKFTTDRKQLFANVAFNTWSMIHNLCEQGYHTFCRAWQKVSTLSQPKKFCD